MTQQTQIQEFNQGGELSVFNPNVYEGISRIASTLANSSLIPDSFKGDGKSTYPPEKVAANCFLVVAQAHRWGMDPFAVMGCASVIHGKLMWEGKLIHAIIEQKLGIRLKYEFNDKSGDDFGVVVSGTFEGIGETETVEGTVGDWKTTGNNSPWTKLSQRKSMLRYRGAREWARAHAPGVILGIVTHDEAEDFESMKPADPADRVITREQMAEQTQKSLPEETKQVLDQSDKRIQLLAKVEQAWKALKKTGDDFRAMLKYYKLGDGDDFADMTNEQLEDLLLKLQDQMNKQAGKTVGQIAAENKAKSAKREDLELEGGVL